jgi:hypothetical protein
MLPAEDVKIETFRLLGGGVSLQITHRPTGIVLVGDPGNKPYRKRLAELLEQLEMLVNTRYA